MSPFLRAVVTRLESEREARILATRGNRLSSESERQAGILRATAASLKHRSSKLAMRREAVADLRARGFDTYSISQRLGVSEYCVRVATSAFRVQP